MKRARAGKCGAGVVQPLGCILLACTVWCLWGSPAGGAAEREEEAWQARLARLGPGDMTGEAVKWVGEAPQEGRQSRAMTVVRAAGRAKPPELAQLLAAMAGRFPDTAGPAAGEAARLRPEEAKTWAATTAAAAPVEAGRVTGEMCRVLPRQFAEITLAAARAAPESSHSILFELSEALPDLRPYLERAKTLVSSGRARRPAVGLIIHQTVEILVNDGTEAARRWLPVAKPDRPEPAGPGPEKGTRGSG